MFGVATKEVVVVMFIRVQAADFRCVIGVDESDTVGCRVKDGVADGFAGMLGLMESLQLLRMQLRDGEAVVIKEKGTAVCLGGEADLRIPLTEVLHELPMPGRQSVGGLARAQRSERQQQQQDCVQSPHTGNFAQR